MLCIKEHKLFMNNYQNGTLKTNKINNVKSIFWLKYKLLRGVDK